MKEDLYLDYKHGDILKDTKPSEVVREYISGFANSAGGVLIIGVKESISVAVEITGCNDDDKGDLDEWASTCLTEIANYFSPQPRIQVVNHSNGPVLVIAVQRSLNLVPIIKNGKTVYHFRIHDQTLKSPDYLLSDLLLGRRQQPKFEIAETKILNFQRDNVNDRNLMNLSFDIRIKVENASIVWAEDALWGAIIWTTDPITSPHSSSGKPSQHLLSYLDIIQESFGYPKPKYLEHRFGSISLNRPFDIGIILTNFIVPIRLEQEWFSYKWKSALYLIARNSVPLWFQIEFEIGIDSIKYVDDQKIIVTPDPKFLITKIYNDRPKVAWEKI